MKKIINLSFIALFTIATLPVNAQTDAKAKTILEAVSKKMNGLKSLKANFALRLNGKVKDTKKGTFYMKGPKYRVSLGSQEIICDNKTVWTYMKDAKEVQVSNYNPNEQSISPAKLFTNFYDKEYSYKHAGTKAVNGKNCDIIVLTPLNKSKQFSKVELAITKDNTIAGGRIWEKNGNEYQYDVNGFTPNASVDESLFTFDTKKFPGVEVVDLR
jgi:outer membrane lipoprotein carrier protein